MATANVTYTSSGSTRSPVIWQDTQDGTLDFFTLNFSSNFASVVRGTTSARVGFYDEIGSVVSLTGPGNKGFDVAQGFTGSLVALHNGDTIEFGGGNLSLQGLISFQNAINDVEILGLDNGNIQLFWTEDVVDGDGFGVFQREYRLDGIAVSSTQMVNVRTLGNQQNIDTVQFNDGGYAVFFTDDAQGAPALRARFYDENGAAITNQVQIPASGVNNAVESYDTEILSNGNVAVVWVDADLGRAFGRVFDQNGAPVGGQFRVNHPGIDLTTGVVAVDQLTNGDLVVGYSSFDSVANRSDFFYRKFGIDGTPVGSRVTTDENIGAFGLSMHALADGGFIMTRESNATHSFNVYEQGTDLPDIEKLDGTRLSYDAGNGNDLIDGSDADETIFGGDGSDTIRGGAGNDTIFLGDGSGRQVGRGQSGNDVLNATEASSLFGGEGDDVITGSSGGDFIDGGTGDDIIFSSSGPTNQADTIFGKAGNDLIRGGEGGDIAYGGAGDDVIDLDGGNNTFFGGNGRDSLSGDRDRDVMFGGFGRDTLEGANGDDILSGGAGADTFVYLRLFFDVSIPPELQTISYGNDIITDFEDGVDALVLSQLFGTTFNDLVIQNIGGNAVIFQGNDSTITLQGMGGLLDSSDISFA
ncbi:MAG: calcium-binding protein [Pseudomonadota bacterium]